MATTPFRTYSAHPAVWDVSWDVAGAGVPTEAEEFLHLRQDNTGGGYVRLAAAGFRPTYPAWTTEGNINKYRDNSLAFFVEKPVSPCDLEVRFPAVPLTAGMTIAALNAAWAAGTAHATAFAIESRGWYVVSGIGSGLFPTWLVANGVLLGLNARGMGSFIYDACLGRMAQGRGLVAIEHWTYGGLWPVSSGASYADYDRPDVSALADYLYGLIPAEVRIVEAALLLSEQDTSETDIDLPEQVQAGGSVTLRASVPALESWASGTEPFGTLSLAKADTALEGSNMLSASVWSRLHGTPARFAMNLVRPDNGTALAELVTIRAQVGHAEEYPGGVDVELLSPSQIDLDGVLRQFWPDEATGTLDYDEEMTIQVLWSLLLAACPRTHWDSVLYFDWSWLGLRFGGTFWMLNLTALLTAGYDTVRALWDALLPYYALCCGTDLSGNLTVWHPAAYRPSLRVHTLDPLEEFASNVRLMGLESAQYDGVRLAYTYDGTEYAQTMNADRQLCLCEGGRIADITLDDDIFDVHATYYHIQQALSMQMIQRLCYPAVRLSFDIGLVGMTWRLGDQLVISSDVYGLAEKTFMITSLEASPMGSTVSVEAVHYTGWPGGHSTFREAGPRGIWRWRNENGFGTTSGKDLSNMTWNPAPLPSMVIGGGGGSWDTNSGGGTWEAALLEIEETGAYDVEREVETAPVTYAGVLAGVTSGSDQIDVQLACVYDSVQLTGYVSHDWLWRWWNTATGVGLALLLYAPSAPNPDTSESVRLVLANCSNCNPGIGGWAAVITASLTLPYGFTRPSGLTPGEPGLIRSISVAWDATNTARVFDGQRYVGTLNSTPNKASGGMNRFDLRTPALRPSLVTFEYLHIGLVRLISHASAPAASLMLPHDGLDPYYP